MNPKEEVVDDASIVKMAAEAIERTVNTLRSLSSPPSGFVLYVNSDCTAVTAGLTSVPIADPSAVKPATWDMGPDNIDDFTALGEAFAERASRTEDVGSHVRWCFRLLGDALKQLRASEVLPREALILIDDFDPSDRTEALSYQYSRELNSPTTFERWHQAL